MAEVTMPRLSDTMEEGTIAAWLKKPGDEVSKGEVIAQIETDKATMDLTSFEAGTLQEIIEPEGATVQIGKPVARIGSGAAPAPRSDAAARSSDAAARPSNGTSAPASAAPESSAAQAPEPTAESSQPIETAAVLPAEPAVSEPAAEPPDGKVRASPVARHLAAEHGLDLSHIQGSGPQGRVIRSDVEAALATGAQPVSGPGQTAPAPGQQALPPEQQAAPGQQPAPSAVQQPAPAPQPPKPAEGDERVPLSQMRRTIARRMAESTRTVPHFFLTVTVDATELVKLRKQIVDQGVKVSFNDLVVKGAALALRKIPEVNVSFAEDSLIKHQRVDIGIAVATERGLIVPVIRKVDQKALSQIAAETRDLAERAQSGKLQPNEYSGGTFTVSNLGMFGVEQFNAVINPPEAAILAVGAIIREPAEFSGEIALRERMHLTLSVDHRALDGAIGARYLQSFKEFLEKPLLLLV
jgi:pyruvate dehydrogenase E2 component (dihydrolipoamide acetyltransferase)